MEILKTNQRGARSLIAHSLCVAKLALIFGQVLQKASYPINGQLLIAAGILHDIAKGKPNHDIEGEKLIAAMGHSRLAALIGSHKNIGEIHTTKIPEEEILYLSDKMIDSDRIVDLRSRFQKKRILFIKDPKILNTINTRFKNARSIQKKVETSTHTTIREITQRYNRIKNDYLFTQTW